MNKIFRANYNIIYDILFSVFFTGKYSNKMIEKEFKFNKKLGSRDRKFIAESVYDIVRWWRKLVYSCGIDESEITDRQLDEVINTWFKIKNYNLPEYVELNLKKIDKNVKRWNFKGHPFAIEHSFCDDISQKIISEFGEEAGLIAQELNKKAPIYLRVNLKNTSVAHLIEELKAEKINVEIDDDVKTCLKLTERANVFRSKSFRNGLFEVQDKGSQVISDFLGVEPGMKVVDACAGAGGKTLHIADKMNNKGRIISLDIHQWKLDELKKRAKRNKVDNIEIRLIENTKVIKRLKGQMDRVLLDVPCSGFGVIKRNPDTKWKHSNDNFNELLSLQKNILDSYSSMVKLGGSLVYSTCSVFKEENSDQVNKFLDAHSNWEFDEDQLILPTKFNSDGFYMARLTRKN